ncbi:hypothetical protein AMATHDRAFT_65359 [Amanita thiersii Skay4041]|uniref:Uncharacterized protein n=1 Tax=Amanita thiersii Skay4041 TaxID=703135 RepID=A0A2A9NJN2_9AGAR|nr:hypothetical protein AMATHDRAFT_65359 [Amanita thiersii Skay4041]
MPLSDWFISFVYSDVENFSTSSLLTRLIDIQYMFKMTRLGPLLRAVGIGAVPGGGQGRSNTSKTVVTMVIKKDAVYRCYQSHTDMRTGAS